MFVVSLPLGKGQLGVRRTRDVLQAGGFTVHYVEIPHHDHDYAALADSVNRDAWRFLSGFSLEEKK